jgi:glutathione S-transferase
MTAPVTIVGSFISPYVRKVLAALNLKGERYVVDPITPFFGNDEFERLSPLRRIPVLIDGDFAISDSSVISAYIDGAFAGHPLYPTDVKDRARALWFEEYADSRLGDVIIWAFFYQKIVHPMVWGEAGDVDRIADAEENLIPSECDYLERQLPDAGYLFGEIGTADISIASFFVNAGFAIDPATSPKLAAFVDRVRRHPAVAPLLDYDRIARSVDIRDRRQALLNAGVPLTETTMGLKEPRRGKMRL